MWNIPGRSSKGGWSLAIALGIVESGLEVIAGQTEDFTGMQELLETDS